MTTDLSKQSQTEIIEKQIKETGEVSRNWCLQRFITRLSARILDLKNSGYEFEVERRGRDYVYKWIREPKQLEMFAR